MSGIDEFIRHAIRPEKALRLCPRGDLTGALDVAERELAAARGRRSTSLSDDTGVAAAQTRVDELRAQVDIASVTFTLRGVSARQWSDLVAANPPRDGNAGDQAYGYNTDDLFTALVAACLIDPEATPAQVADLADALSSGQWDLLVETAVNISRGKVDIPFSPAVSEPTEGSA